MILHKTKGLNPAMTYCRRCGGLGPELILLGSIDKVYKCVSCGASHIGRPEGNTCMNHRQEGDTSVPCRGHVSYDRDIKDGERLPGGFCQACQDELAEHESVVVGGGGVYWECQACDAAGVIKPNDFTEAVREAHAKGICGANKPDEHGKWMKVGVSFTKEECPACGGRREHTLN